MNNLYILTIATNQYSGNFERELCAFVTGMVGDCGVGQDEADEFRQTSDHNFEDIISFHPDENSDVLRPCSIWPTEGRWNDGYGRHHDANANDPANGPRYPAYESVAIFFNDLPTDSQIEFMKDRAYRFALRETGLEILGFGMVVRTTADSFLWRTT